MRSRFVAWSVASALTVSAYVGVLPSAIGVAHADEYKPDALHASPPTPRPERHSPSRANDPAWQSPATTAPAPGEADVDLPATGMARAGSLPVLVGRAASNAPSRVHVKLLDQQHANAVGARFVAVQVNRADGSHAGGDVKVAVDYASFAKAYGGDFATRLRLVKVPACANAPTCPPVSLPTKNDLTTQRLTVDDAPADADPLAPTVDADSTSMGEPLSYDESVTTLAPDSSGFTTMAVMSGVSGSTADYSATPFQQSDKWQVGIGSGGFSYTYDIPLPPPVAGPVPRLALDYSSQSVDGRTASQNAQPSQIGEGWSFEPGYVERRFVPCRQDGTQTPIDDYCWGGTIEHYLHLNGRTSELVRPLTGGNEWRLRDDPAWRVQHFSGTYANGDYNKTYWVVTTPDGTRYYFGSGQEPTSNLATNSTWTMPVFGNNVGEACYNVVLQNAYCDAAWRFNLDYVRDLNGNAATIFWNKETNYYKRGGQTNAVYVRGGYATKVEYSQRSGSENANAPSVVNIRTANRCTVVNCAIYGQANYHDYEWPDVPSDLFCTSGGACPQTSPSFFSTMKVTQFDTWVLGGGGYSEVSEIRLNHTFPATGESVNPVLWLDTIQRFGKAGGTELALPQVTLYGDKYANRVDNDPGNGVPATYKYRVVAIRDEIGGEAEVTYGQPHPCSPIPVNDWANNTKDCFPQWVTVGGSSGWGAYNKYLVTKMTAIDDTGISPDVVTNYTYLDTPAWHYDDAINGTNQSWSDFRGHSRVQVSTPGPASSTTNTVYTLFRGMNGDKSANGTPRSVSIGPDSEGSSFTDSNWLAGQTIEVAHYSPGGTFLSAELSRYWAQNTVMGQTAYTQHNAQYVRPNISIAKYYDTSTENTGWHRRRVDTTYDSTYSYVTQVYDNGDTTVTGDETCAKTSTTPNSTNWILSAPYQTYTYDANCVQSNPPVIGRHDVYYDGLALGATPTVGMPTTVGDNVNANDRALTRMGYDALGRVTRVVSPRYYTADTPATTTTYSPSTGYPTSVTVTDTKLHTATTVPNSMFGGVSSVTDANTNTTTVVRDPLGRTVKVVKPDPAGAPGATVEAVRYTYNVSYVSPSWVKRSVMQTASQYLDDYTYVDGFGHTVETQSRSPFKDANGTITGRIVTSTRYDSQGHVAAQTQPQYEAASVGSGIVNPSPVWVHSEERSEYDALGRAVDAAHWRYNVEYWHTATNHYGTHDRIDYPVRNDVRRYTNALGQLTRVAESLVSTSVVTDYTYTPRGDLDTITDDSGDVWDYDYDWQGRRTRSKDPDQGTWDTTYDLEGHVLTVKDALASTVTYAYDELGRKTSLAKGATTLATWTYDTANGGVGLPATSTRVDSGSSYTTAITAYDNHGRPTAKNIVIPASEGPLAGTYAYSYGYDYADHPTSVTFPAAGGLAVETVNTSYDVAGFARTMSSTLASYVSATNYTGEGRPLDRSLPSSTVRSYAYNDVAKRLTNITTAVGSATVEANRWVYDSESNVTAIVDEKVPTSKEVECFGYDVRDQLTRAFTRTGDETGCGTQTVGGADPYDLTYTINTIGNITSVKSGAVTTSYTYPTPGPTAIRPHAVTAVGSATYHYDSNGAMDVRTGDAMAWDELHQLKTYTATSGTTTYVYDADGNRLLRKIGSSPTRTLYLDGMELTAVGTGAVGGIRYYGSFAMRDSTGVTVLLRNNQGSTTVEVLPDGTPHRRKYLPYGGQRGAQDLTATERGFLDKTEDGTGLVAVGARYYDPSIAKFASPDPLSPQAPAAWSPYAYAGLNPATFADPTGLMPCRTNCDDATDPTPAQSRHDRAARMALTYIGLGVPVPDRYMQGAPWTSEDRAMFKAAYLNSPCFGIDTSNCLGNSPVINACGLSGGGNCSGLIDLIYHDRELNTVIWILLMAESEGAAQQNSQLGAGPVIGAELAEGEEASAVALASDDAAQILYRHVDEAELADIEASGEFRIGPNGTGKYFAESEADAAEWGQRMRNQGGAVVSTAVPESFLENMMRFENLDGIGNALYLSPELIQVFNDISAGITIL